MKAREISKKLLSWSILLLCWFLTSSTFAQQNFILRGKEYRFENGKWYSYFEDYLGDEIIQNRLIIRLADRGHLESFDFQGHGIRSVSLASKRILNGYYILQVLANEDPFHVAALLDTIGIFDVLGFDARGQNAGNPNDSYFSQQWNLDQSKLRMAKAWDISTGSSSVILAVIDRGTLWTHEDLADNIWINPNEIAGNGIDDEGNGRIDDIRGWDFVSNDNNPQDEGTHGTRAAGVIAARTYNFPTPTGLAGIAGGWQSQVGVRLIGLRIVFNDVSNWDQQRARDAINYLTWFRQQYGYTVIANMSISHDESDANLVAFKNAVDAARNAGVIIVGTTYHVYAAYPADVTYPREYFVSPSLYPFVRYSQLFNQSIYRKLKFVEITITN